MRVPALGLLASLLLACSPSDPPPDDTPRIPVELAGHWRAVLASPGGELPFGLELARADGDGFEAWIHNGEERTGPLPVAWVSRSELEIGIPWYDAEIRARLAPSDGGPVLEGEWRRTGAEADDSRLPFQATLGTGLRFRPRMELGLVHGSSNVASPAGEWSVRFVDEDGMFPARAELRDDDGVVTGTFRTPTGDYRYLEGAFEDGLLRMSTFDGAHAFLFEARARDDGTLAGDFWSRDRYHATWTAERRGDAPGDPLPDAWSALEMADGIERLEFTFDDLDGRAVSLSDERFRGRVVLVNVFGSWCPNCNDEAPLLAAWHRRWAAEGLEVVGLAYEYTGDVERDRRQLRRFAERHDVGYPLLLAGTSDKTDAAATLPGIDRIVAYPTTIFVGRDGRVRAIHSGFEGPGTGEHHERLVDEMERRIEALLGEPVPG